jgi:hypothetical protein
LFPTEACQGKAADGRARDPIKERERERESERERERERERESERERP